MCLKCISEGHNVEFTLFINKERSRITQLIAKSLENLFNMST
jgi:hypothetical protein